MARVVTEASARTVQGVLDLTAPSPDPGDASRARASQAVAPLGALATGLDALFARFGVASSAERDVVQDAVRAELSARGYDAQVTSVRHGTLRLRTCPQTARFLRYDVAALLAAVQARAPGVVERIVVEVDPAARTPAVD